MKRKDFKSEIYKSVKSKRKAIRNVGPSYSLGKDCHLSLGCYFDSWFYFLALGNMEGDQSQLRYSFMDLCLVLISIPIGLAITVFIMKF